MLVINYGLRPPTKNADVVHEQMRAAHRYRNTLVEIEIGRRNAVRSVYAMCGDLPVLKQRAEKAAEHAAKTAARVKAYKAEHRTRKIPENMRADLDTARIAERDAAHAWKAARQAARTDEVQAEIDRINGLASELCRSAYKYSDCYTETKVQVVLPAMDAVRKSPYWGVMRERVWYPLEPNNPSFVRWQGEGHVGVQIKKEFPVHAVESNTFLQIERVPDRFGRPNSPWAILRLRVGSDRRKPVWAEWPMKMRRPLPMGQIKGATVSLRMIGPRAEWTVQITVDNEAIVRPSGDGAVAVNIGWRKKADGGIRVAYAVDEEGKRDELVISSELISSLQKADELKSIRDQRFNVAREALLTWLAEHESPEWLRCRVRTMHAWRSQARLASLVLFWREHRFDGDSYAYDALEQWRYRDHHLWSWASDQRVKTRRHRRDIYRVWAARLAERYHTIVLHEHNLGRAAKKPPEDDDDNEIARANRQLVAPSELRLCLINAKRTRDGATVQMPASRVTQTCHVCGEPESFDASLNINHKCSRCGTLWDQDDNAARNTLWLYRERSDDAKILGTARKVEILDENGQPKETKRQRIARLRKEKEARLATARISGCNHVESCLG